MADFKIAYGLTGHNEGGYANNIDDHGGETYCGIARKFWGDWPGWKLVDAVKENNHTPHEINTALSIGGAPIHLMVSGFYKQNFWDINKLDQFNDQQIANNVYDFGVNSGVGKAAKTLQQVLGTLTVDGVIGNRTVAAVNGGNAKNIYMTYNIARGEFYHSLAKNPDQLQFLHSWLSRLLPYKTT